MIYHFIGKYRCGKGGAQSVVANLLDCKANSQVIALDALKNFLFLLKFFRSNVYVYHRPLLIFPFLPLIFLGFFFGSRYYLYLHNSSFGIVDALAIRISSLLHFSYIHVSYASRSCNEKYFPSLVRRQSMVIYNSVPTSYLNLPVNTVDISQPLDLFSVARLVPQKNLGFTLYALSEIPQLWSNFYIFGTGPEENDLKALAKKLKIYDRVVFCGFMTNWHCKMHHHSIYISTTKFEGFGISTYEALFAGFRCIIPKLDVFTELLSPYAIFYTPNSSSSFKKALMNIHEFPLCSPQELACRLSPARQIELFEDFICQ